MPGVVYRRGGGIARNPPARPARLDTLPAPSFAGLDLDLLPARLLPLQTATRCHWGRCVFCYHDFRGLPADRRPEYETLNPSSVRRERISSASSIFTS